MNFQTGAIARYAGIILLCGMYALGGEIYKTVDAQGHIIYSDHPISSTSQPLALQVTTANPQEAARLSREQALQTADAAQSAQQAQKDTAEQQKKAATDAAQKQRCDAARTRYAVFAAGGRIFKSDDQGNRAYYSDEQIAAEAATAKAAMDSACPQ
jgi:hypothetical protein